MAMMRSNKRAATHAGHSARRGDCPLSADDLAALREKNKQMQARKRRGSVSIGEAASDDEITQVWREATSLHVHGHMTEGQSHMDERELYFSNGSRIVSHRVCQTVPFYLAQSPSFPGDVKAALVEAFESAQADLVGHALTNQWDVQASGSTGVACLWKDNKVWTANVGDSRCIIGSETERKLLFETADHKPDTESERARIESSGGEVRSKTYPDGWVNHRIFVKGTTYPGLCMARTFGDESVKAHGVIATPEVEEVTLDLNKKPFIILASDGVWEFMDSQFVIKAMSKRISSDGAKASVQKLQREAQKRWQEEEGDYCDDITSVLIQLR